MQPASLPAAPFLAALSSETAALGLWRLGCD